ncbi:MAG: PAS domain S-box protein [Candidatus Solibacter sp.]
MDVSAFASAPEGGVDALQKRITDLEAEVLDLRRQLPVEGHGSAPGTAQAARDPHWHMLANAMPHIVWVAPSFGAIDFINDHWYRYTGLPPGSMSQDNWTAALHPDDLPAIAAMWDRALATGGEVTFEYRVRRADGAWRWHQGVHRPVRNAESTIENWVGVAFDIHDRKLAETALRDAEERDRAANQALQLLIDHAPDGLFVADASGRYVSVNPAAGALLGYSRAELLEMRVQDLVRPEDLERQAQTIAKLADGNIQVSEWELRSKSGEWIPVEITAKLLPDGRMQAFVRDIRERRRLQSAALHLAAIVESSDDAIISKDLNGVITSWNQSAERVFGYTAGEVTGKHISILIPPDRLAEEPEILRRLQLGERVDHFETIRRRKDGTLLNISLTISPVRDSTGRIVGASKIARDITEWKQAAAERTAAHRREQEARQTAELLNRIGPALASELSLDRLAQYITDIATELVGAEFGAFFHNLVNENGESYTLYTLSGVPREAFAHLSMPRITGVFAPTFRGEGIVLSEDITQDPRYGHNPPHHGMPKGHVPVRSYLAAPVQSRSQEVLGGLFLGHSQPGRFSERHVALLSGLAAQAAIALDNARLFEQSQWAQEELERSNRDLRRANQDLETFAYSASHDLQEPLRMISISAQLLARDAGKLSENSRNFLNGIEEGAGRMQTLIEDLLSYTRATRQGDGPVPRLDSGVVLERVLQQLRPAIEESAARVVVDGPLPQIAIHEVHLTQLFQNLISNALKYRSAEDPYVHISALERENGNVFSVSDNGLGIDFRFADQIFGLFKRLHTRAEYPGSGIGLAICKRIVEQYGGRIWLDRSAPGDGSVFSFSFPIEPKA